MTNARGSDSPTQANVPISRARAAVALLLAINLFNYIDRQVLSAVESRIGHELLGGDPHQLAKMGSLATAFLVSYLVTAPIFGWLADRMSRWILVGLGVLVWSLASGGSGLAATFAMLLITRTFVGVGEAAYGPAAPTIISDLYPVSRRGYVLAWFYMAIPVGSAIGYVWGGQFEKWLGWRWAFYTVVPPGLLLATFCFLFRDPRQSAARRDRSSLDSSPAAKPAKLAQYTSLLRNRSYVLDCAGMTAMTFAIGGIQFFMPRYISEFRNAGDLAHVNFVFGMILVVGGLTATLAGGIAGDWFRSRHPGSYFIVSAIAIFISCPFVILMLYTSFPAAWGVIAVAIFFLFFNTGPSNTILANVTHPSIRSTAFAVNIFLIHLLGDAISPWLMGLIVGSQSRWNLAFYVVAAMMALAAMFWLWGARYLARDTAAVENALMRQGG